MLSIVENGLDARAVGGEDRLSACGEVYSVVRVSRTLDLEKRSSMDCRPSDVPIQACGICLLVIIPEAHI